MSERHFRRLRDRHEAEGAEGIVDRRLGRASARRAPLDQIEWVLELYWTRYWDFTVKHFHEHLLRDHGFKLGYTWTKTRLQARRPAWSRRPRSAAPTARSARAGRCRACWSSRTAHPIAG